MNETTFWPTEEQATRIATAYRPGPNGMGLEATKIDQLHYPLTDRTERFVMPAGGLFATATDLARFYQMLASGGVFEGQRLLSEDAVAELTTKQTPEAIPTEYGLGFSTRGNRFGHGGAYSTNSCYDRSSGLILIWLVQHAGFPGNGGESQAVFHAAALKAFGPS